MICRLLLASLCFAIFASCAMSRQHWADNYAGMLDEDYNHDAIALDPNPYGPPEAAYHARRQYLTPFDYPQRMAQHGYIDPNALTTGTPHRIRQGRAE